VRHPVHLNNPEFDTAAQEEQRESRHRLASENECGLSDIITEPALIKFLAHKPLPDMSDTRTSIFSGMPWYTVPSLLEVDGFELLECISFGAVVE
jgi:hypothetical protein